MRRVQSPEVKVGIPSIIHAALLPRLIGNARAGWLLTGEPARYMAPFLKHKT